MAVTTTYAGTLTSPTCELGYFMRPETVVRLGSAKLWATGGLETTSTLYTVYEASVGLQAGQGFVLGCLNSLNFTYEPDYQPVEVINIADAVSYELVGEECSVSIELYQWDPDVLSIVIGSGEYHTVPEGTDAQVTFGGGCGGTTRPLVIEGINKSCNLGSISDLTDGVEAFVITLYDCRCTSGMNTDLMANENSTINTEWEVIPVNALEAGNRLGNIYFYAG